MDEPASRGVYAAVASDSAMATWWGTQVECASAAARLEREGALDAAGMETALRRLETLAAQWIEVEPSERLRGSSIRLLRVHPLRAADALQLAAALAAAEDHPSSLPFVTLDRHLADAARREGFPVVEPA